RDKDENKKGQTKRTARADRLFAYPAWTLSELGQEPPFVRVLAIHPQGQAFQVHHPRQQLDPDLLPQDLHLRRRKRTIS
ncbi:MAG: hypothetical protein VX969_07245, partial [Verrucomicrobiota bacterium]|nr:hypothetical protein [Verrucomicrobiota bacterium]